MSMLWVSSRIRARVSQSTQSGLLSRGASPHVARSARAHHGAQSHPHPSRPPPTTPSSFLSPYTPTRTHSRAFRRGRFYLLVAPFISNANPQRASLLQAQSTARLDMDPGRRRRRRRRGRWRRGRRRHHRECGRPDMTGRRGGHSIVGRPPGKQHTGRETGVRGGAVCCLLCCAVRPSYQHKPMPSVVTAHVWSWAHEIVAQVYPVGTVVLSTLVDKPTAPQHIASPSVVTPQVW